LLQVQRIRFRLQVNGGHERRLRGGAAVPTERSSLSIFQFRPCAISKTRKCFCECVAVFTAIASVSHIAPIRWHLDEMRCSCSATQSHTKRFLKWIFLGSFHAGEDCKLSSKLPTSALYLKLSHDRRHTPLPAEEHTAI
jgi:hypothetical protein